MKRIARLPRRRVIFIVVAIMLLAGTIFFARGWLRSDGVLWYAHRHVKPDVVRHFDEDFMHVNEWLMTFGIPIKEKNSEVGCHEPMYEGLRVSSSCYKNNGSTEMSAFRRDSIIGSWEVEEPRFERYLLDNGWVKQWNEQQDIAKIFKPGQDAATIGVSYAKQHGKTECRISVGYNAFDPDGREVFIDEHCYRYIQIFGGY